ncbi:hypothetical protein SAMN05216167_1368 [Spirosoma endophyticum]|uniref:Uncharacterized protein n=1 Tax=Spirosoma endophyticum TaxID=662367 RepID=A0A1I2GX94_9BACT|nr:hypothetical protein SAMN05216167_1368 [Spirosoma endophyticum]
MKDVTDGHANQYIYVKDKRCRHNGLILVWIETESPATL